jgi:FkbM family methyltransferase
MLWRALKSVGRGFYIDLGAAEPETDSVTKAFYDRGWRGINVEPMPKTFDRLRHARPRDINLQLAVEDIPGRKTYFGVDDQNGLSTGQSLIATGYAEVGRAVSELEVDVDTLDHICRTYVNEEIHFLKVDVEGGEDAVFAGADLRAYRPWMIVIESPEAARIPRLPEWHKVLDAAGYKYVYYDGLNRFYIALEKTDLLEPSFGSPPNWFDNYVTAHELQLEEAADSWSSRDAELTLQLQAETGAREGAELALRALSDVRDQLQAQVEVVSVESTELRAHIVALQGELEACYQVLFEKSRHIGSLSVQRQKLLTDLREQEGSIAALHAQLGALEGSRAWRLTRPMRALAWRARSLGGRSARSE